MTDDDFSKGLQEAKRLFLDGRTGEAARLMIRLGLTSQQIQGYFDQWYKEEGGPKEFPERPERKALPPSNVPAVSKKARPPAVREESKPPAAKGPPQLPPQQEAKPEQPKRKRLPFFRTVGISRRGDIVWSLVMIIIGMTGAALLGSMWIFFSFLALALYILVPGPDEVIAKGMDRLKAKYIRLLSKPDLTPEQKKDIRAMMSQEMENQRNIQRIKSREGFMRYGISSIKYLFKALFFVFFSLGFITSAIPLMKPLGIFIAFVGYFMEG